MVNPFDLAIAGQRPAVDYNRLYLDALCLKHPQHFLVAGPAAQLPPIADDENQLPSGALAPAKIQRRAQDSVIQNVSLPGRGIDGRDDRSSRGSPVNGRSV